jgi:hypothetical protein
VQSPHATERTIATETATALDGWLRVERHMDQEQIEKIFTYHAPTPNQVDKYNQIRTKGREFALFLNAVLPESREKSVAITNLQSCVQMANAAIAIANDNSAFHYGYLDAVLGVPKT